MPDGYILGLDAGTSVVKAAIFDLQGNELSRGARSVPITNPEPHLAEEDMQEVWVAATEAISHALVNSSVRADEILGISATGQGDGSWLLEKPLPAAPGLVDLHCDVHPWMQAWVATFNHDQFAVSDAAGRFRIDASGRQIGYTSYLMQWQDGAQKLVWPTAVAEAPLRPTR